MLARASASELLPTFAIASKLEKGEHQGRIGVESELS